MPHDIVTRVSANTELGNGNYLLEFESPEIAERIQPAQFLMIGIPHTDLLLRRPFSVCGLPGTFDGRPPDALQLLLKVVGKGTKLLADLQPGSELSVLGPLGRGFHDPEPSIKTAVFIAGGIGSAPFPALAARFSGKRQIQMFYGGRSQGDLPLLDWFSERADSITACTEDGSLGHTGFVTEPFQELLSSHSAGPLHVYACGPEAMLREVARLAREYGVICDLALEAHMACGFGACMGCVVPVRNGAGEISYERVCMDGPVMRSDRLAW